MKKPRIFSVTVPDALYQKLRALAFKNDEKLAAVVRMIIRDYFSGR